MIFPSPEDLGQAPAWENYVVRQATQATLGAIPRNALALGVRVHGRDIRVTFQLKKLTNRDAVDMADIVSDLEDLVGDEINVGLDHEILAKKRISPTDGVVWIYLAR